MSKQVQDGVLHRWMGEEVKAQLDWHSAARPLTQEQLTAYRAGYEQGWTKAVALIRLHTDAVIPGGWEQDSMVAGAMNPNRLDTADRISEAQALAYVRGLGREQMTRKGICMTAFPSLGRAAEQVTR